MWSSPQKKQCRGVQKACRLHPLLFYKCHVPPQFQIVSYSKKLLPLGNQLPTCTCTCTLLKGFSSMAEEVMGSVNSNWTSVSIWQPLSLKTACSFAAFFLCTCTVHADCKFSCVQQLMLRVLFRAWSGCLFLLHGVLAYFILVCVSWQQLSWCQLAANL